MVQSILVSIHKTIDADEIQFKMIKYEIRLIIFAFGSEYFMSITERQSNGNGSGNDKSAKKIKIHSQEMRVVTVTADDG